VSAGAGGRPGGAGGGRIIGGGVGLKKQHVCGGGGQFKRLQLSHIRRELWWGRFWTKGDSQGEAFVGGETVCCGLVGRQKQSRRSTSAGWDTLRKLKRSGAQA